MHVERRCVEYTKLVYVVLADRGVDYPTDSSRVVYIGRTSNGFDRISESVNALASPWRKRIFQKLQIDLLTARVVTCTPRQRVQTWAKLERALLGAFREIHGRVPWGNRHGMHLVADSESRFFRRRDVLRVLSPLRRLAATIGRQL
jgi:hypothetical protein